MNEQISTTNSRTTVVHPSGDVGHPRHASAGFSDKSKVDPDFQVRGDGGGGGGGGSHEVQTQSACAGTGIDSVSIHKQGCIARVGQGRVVVQSIFGDGDPTDATISLFAVDLPHMETVPKSAQIVNLLDVPLTVTAGADSSDVLATLPAASSDITPLLDVTLAFDSPIDPETAHWTLSTFPPQA